MSSLRSARKLRFCLYHPISDIVCSRLVKSDLLSCCGLNSASCWPWVSSGREQSFTSTPAQHAFKGYDVLDDLSRFMAFKTARKRPGNAGRKAKLSSSDFETRLSESFMDGVFFENLAPRKQSFYSGMDGENPGPRKKAPRSQSASYNASKRPHDADEAAQERGWSRSKMGSFVGKEHFEGSWSGWTSDQSSRRSTRVDSGHAFASFYRGWRKNSAASSRPHYNQHFASTMNKDEGSEFDGAPKSSASRAHKSRASRRRTRRSSRTQGSYAWSDDDDSDEDDYFGYLSDEERKWLLREWYGFQGQRFCEEDFYCRYFAREWWRGARGFESQDPDSSGRRSGYNQSGHSRSSGPQTPGLGGHPREIREHLAVLGLNPATELKFDTLKAAFRRCALQHHPDLHGNCRVEEQKFKAGQSAYEALRTLCAN